MASGHLPFGKPQKLEARHGSSSRTTPYFPHDTCEIPSQPRKKLLWFPLMCFDATTKYMTPAEAPMQTPFALRE
jgi:hypothetical protein